MAGDTLTTFSPSQKEVYCGIINEVLNSRAQIGGYIDTIDAQGGGVINTAPGTTATRGLHFDVHVSRNSTGGAQPPEQGFPTSGNQGYRQGYFQGRTIYWPMSVTRAAVVRTKGSEAAYAQVMVEAAARTAKDLQNEEERMLLGDGSGTLATLTTTAITFAAGIATIFIDNYQDLLKIQIGQILTAWTLRTNAGTQVTMITAGTGTPTTAVVVTGITLSTTAPSIQVGALDGGTITAMANMTGSAVIVLAKGSDGTGVTTNQAARSPTLRYEPNGLDGLINDCDTPMEAGAAAGGFCGILAPATYGTAPVSGGGGAANTGGVPQWASYVDRATAGRAFNDTIMQNMLDAAMIKYGERPTIITCSYGARTEFANSKLAIRRTVNSMNISGDTGGGYNESEGSGDFIQYDGIRIVPSRFAPTAFISPSLTASYLAWNQELVKRYQWHGVKFVDDDGLTWRMSGRTPVFEAYLEHTYEIVTFKRNAHAKAIAVLAQSPAA